MADVEIEVWRAAHRALVREKLRGARRARARREATAAELAEQAHFRALILESERVALGSGS